MQQIVDRGKQPAALFSEHQTPFKRQKVDSLHLTLRYFQRHRLPPSRIQRPLRVFAIAFYLEYKARLSADLSAHPFVAQPHRSIRVGLAFCQLEVALWKLARKPGDAIA